MVSISRRFKDYEIIVNAVSFLMVLVEFFVYRAVGFIHSAAYAVLGISSMAALVLYLLYKKYNHRIFKSIYRFSIVFIISCLGICVYDTYFKHLNNRKINNAYLTEIAAQNYDYSKKITGDGSMNLTKGDPLSCIIFRHDTKEFGILDEIYCIKFPDHNESVHYVDDSVKKNAELIDDKGSYRLPSCSKMTVQGIIHYKNQDWDKAIPCFIKASEMNDANSLYYLYKIYKEGYGCKPHPEYAIIDTLKKASKHGSLKAKLELAKYYLYETPFDRSRIETAEYLLKDILYYSPSFETIHFYHCQTCLSALKTLMDLYEATSRKNEAYKVLRKFYKKLEYEQITEFALHKYAILCIETQRYKEAEKLLRYGRSLNSDICYYLTAKLLQERNDDGRYDEEIEKNLLYAAHKLNHQLSRKELSEYYSQKGDTKRADLWQELYNIEYTNIIEKK